jgi:hypothetical protein
MSTPSPEEVLVNPSSTPGGAHSTHSAVVDQVRVGVQASTLAVACILTIIVSLAGAYFMQKLLPAQSPQQKIVTLDTQKLLNEEIKALLASNMTESEREAANVRFVTDLNQQIKERIQQGYVVVQKDALVTGGDTTYDITAELLSTIITKNGSKK